MGFILFYNVTVAIVSAEIESAESGMGIFFSYLSCPNLWQDVT